MDWLLLLACAGRPALPPGVLLVTIDTWRADYLDPVHSPEAWAMAGRGTRFDDAWSPIGLTTAAHASLLTGLLPPHTGMRGNNHHGYRLDDRYLTLAESFASHGWAAGAFVSAWPAGPAGGMGQGFQVFSGPASGERPTAETLSQARAWLARRRGPWFAWVHAYDPHGPYRPPPRDLRATGGSDTDRDRYGAEVHAADRLLGPLVREVLAAGGTVVLSSDHGEVLDEERCGWQHERSAAPEVLRVPLVLAGPGVPVAVRHERVGLVDLFPTIHRLAGLPDPGGHDGIDALAGPGREAWVGEAGLCDPECARGCDPPGFAGKDIAVHAAGRSLLDRPGVGLSGDRSLEHWLDGYRPVQLPPGAPDMEQARALGYAGP